MKVEMKLTISLTYFADESNYPSGSTFREMAAIDEKNLNDIETLTCLLNRDGYKLVIEPVTVNF